MRLMGIEVRNDGVTLSWGLTGSELVRVRVAGNEVFVRVFESIRKAAVDKVVEESVVCARDLGRCSERIALKLEKSELADYIRDLMLMLDEEECIPHEEVLEYADLKGFSEEDAETVIKELLEKGDIEDKGGCYEPVENEEPLDP